MIETVVKNLRQMPYPEMMDLAKQLHNGIASLGATKCSPELLATILAHMTAPISDAAQKEQKTLLQAFSRKRVVNVKKFATGYAIEVPTLPGSTVTGTDLRLMFSQMLDQIITMELMGGGSTRG